MAHSLGDSKVQPHFRAGAAGPGRLSRGGRGPSLGPTQPILRASPCAQCPRLAPQGLPWED